MRRQSIAFLVMFLILMVVQNACGYEHAFLYSDGIMQDLGTFGGTTSYAYGINNSGQVVGQAYTAGNATAHAFLYSDGVMQDLGTLGGADSSATGINNRGEVVGWSTTSSGYQHAFLYSGGIMQDLGTLQGGYGSSYANAINDNEQVVGTDTAGAFLYSGGIMQDLGTLGQWICAYDINNSGQIVGEAKIAGNDNVHAFLKSGNGPLQDLGTLPDLTFISRAGAINDSGQIVGCSYPTEGIMHAFLYINGIMQDLGQGVACDINSKGQVVGGGFPSGGGWQAFLYSGGTMMYFGDGIAYGINDNEQVVGWFDTDTVPEPSILILLATGAIGLLAYVWRRRK
jgi:probable HAF family extracellular repeat protein